MTASQIRRYSQGYQAIGNEPADFLAVIHAISPMTRVGALCFIFGKFMGILAIPAAFIPALNLFVIPLVIIWGSMVFTAIVLCSVDHYRKKKAEAGTETTLTKVGSGVTTTADIAEESLEIEPIIIPLATVRS